MRTGRAARHSLLSVTAKVLGDADPRWLAANLVACMALLVLLAR